MRRVGVRWGTRFGRWLDGYTVPKVTEGLARSGAPVTAGAVYEWLSGRTSPRIEHANALIALSGGRLRVSDIIGHRRIVSQGEELGSGPSIAPHGPQQA